MWGKCPTMPKTFGRKMSGGTGYQSRRIRLVTHFIVFINTKMLILKKRDINIELLMLSATFLLTLY